MDHPHKNRTIIVLSLITIVVSVIVQLGWLLHIPELRSIVPGFEAMRFNTALCFVLLGIALLITQYQIHKYSRFFYILSSLVTLIAVVTLFQNLFHFNTGLDQLFVKDGGPVSRTYPFPGRMSVNTDVCFVLMGLGFLMLTIKIRGFNILAQYLFHIVTILSAIAIIGYLYRASFFYDLSNVGSMAVHTVVLFFFVSISASLLLPTLGIANLFTGHLVGNKMARRFFILIVLTVLILGVLRLESQHYYQFAVELWVSLITVCFLFICLLIIWNTAIWLNKIDRQRLEVETEVKLMNTNLEKLVEQRSAELIKVLERFKESESKFRTAFEYSAIGMALVSFEGYWLKVNKRFCEMIGYTEKELLSMTFMEVTHPDDLEITNKSKEQYKPGESETYHIEKRYLSKNGAVVWVSVNMATVMDNNGKPLFEVSQIEDITERTNAEELILNEKTLSDGIINSLPGIFFLRNEKGKYLRWNENFETATGLTKEEITRVNGQNLIAEEDWERVERAIKKAFKEGFAIVEANGYLKDGISISFLLTWARVIYENQTCLIGTGIDISSRIKAEKELRASEHLYKLLFDSNPLPLWMIAKDDLSVIAVNEAAASLYGYSKDELVNSSIKIFRPQEDLDKQLEGYRRDLHASTDLGVVRHLKKDGAIMFVQIFAHDIIFDGRPVRLSLTNDVTEKLKAEESLQKSEANLQAILKTTDTAYVLFDMDLKVLEFNQKATQFVKEQYDHVVEKGEKLGDYFPPDRFPEFINLAKDVLSGNSISYEVDYPQANGSAFWFYVRLFPITNDNKEILGMMMALNDITERKNAEQDLKNAYGRIQSHINSIKGMAWKQSHLMRSPLANLKALATMLKEHPADTEVLDHFQTELDRLDAIIHEMAEDASDNDIGD